MTNTKEWNIDTSILVDYSKNGWSDDYFSETADGNYGVFIYNINEWRMLAYDGLVAIYDDKRNPMPLLNLSKTGVWFDNDRTFDYAPLSDCLVFRIPAFKENTIRPNFPFLIIRPTENAFGFIEWDSTSIYYGVNELEKDKLIIKEVRPKELQNLKRPNRRNEIIDLKTIVWFDMNYIHKALDIYYGEV